MSDKPITKQAWREKQEEVRPPHIQLPEVTIRPAIDRLEEIIRDMGRIKSVESWMGDVVEDSPLDKLMTELLNEAKKDYQEKWGLTL